MRETSSSSNTAEPEHEQKAFYNNLNHNHEKRWANTTTDRPQSLYHYTTIPKNHQKIYKTGQNIDMWDERRDY